MGKEPWVSDGTAAGSHPIANIAADRAPSSDPSLLTAAGNLLFFMATEGLTSTSSFDTALWRTDGTDAGTIKLSDKRPYTDTFVPTGGPLVFFRVLDTNRFRWMMSDGTVAGTKFADDFQRRFSQLEFRALFPFGDTLFAAVGDSDQTSLWRTTPTPDGTAVNLGAPNPFGMIDFAGKYAFYAERRSNTHDYSLWITDGARAGTYAAIPYFGDTVDQPSRLANANGTLFFLKTLRDGNLTLWKSDGTADGTTPVKSFGATDTFRAQIKAAGHTVFIITGGSLWSSDGTADGTVEPRKITPSSANDDRDDLRVAGNRIVYLDNPDHAVLELWGSDGTKGGTKLLQSLRNFTVLTSIDGLVYFSGSDDAHGTEVWTTDGTVEGTKMLIDMNPGPASSNASGFTKIGNLIYFTAYTDATGRELWALPLTTPALSIAGTHAIEGDSGTSLMHLPVSLTPAAKQAVTVDYLTSDGTARAGSDYDAAAGTITFAPGETARTIDVSVRGDVTPENNETVMVTLRNANGAVITNPEAFGIIDDDDQSADLSVVPQFVDNGHGIGDAASVSNEGPRAATDIVVNLSLTPAYFFRKVLCCSIPQLNSGTIAAVGADYIDPSEQTYISATATARQRDPRSANNVTAWTVSAFRKMAMDAAYLTPGATATVTASIYTLAPVVNSSDPSVVSVPSSITKVTSTLATFVVTALKPGTSTISIQGYQYPLLVTVIAAGTQPRWPGALTMAGDYSGLPFDKPLTVFVVPTGIAPFTAAKATGTVFVTVAGRELARAAVSSTNTIMIPVHLQTLGANPYVITYSGDSNFLPQTINATVFVGPGNVTMTGGLERTPGSAGSYTLTVHAAGSPVASPTGTLSIMNGGAEIAKVTLIPSGGGISMAHATLTNLPASPTVTINYPGDAFYQSGSQQLRVFETRQRSTRH